MHIQVWGALALLSLNTASLLAQDISGPVSKFETIQSSETGDINPFPTLCFPDYEEYEGPTAAAYITREGKIWRYRLMRYSNRAIDGRVTDNCRGCFELGHVFKEIFSSASAVHRRTAVIALGCCGRRGPT